MVNESWRLFANNGVICLQSVLLFILHFFEKEVAILCVAQFSDHRLDKHIILF